MPRRTSFIDSIALFAVHLYLRPAISCYSLQLFVDIRLEMFHKHDQSCGLTCAHFNFPPGGPSDHPLSNSAGYNACSASRHVPNISAQG